MQHRYFLLCRISGCTRRRNQINILFSPHILSKDIFLKEQKETKGDMTHDSYCWLGALPILSVSKTIDPSYKSYGATRPYKHGTAYLLFFLANSHSNQDDLNPAVVIGLIKENDLQLDAEAVGNVDERPKYSNLSKKKDVILS